MINIENIFNDLMFEFKDFIFEGELYFDGILFKFYLIIVLLMLIFLVLGPKKAHFSDLDDLGYGYDKERLRVIEKSFGLQLRGVHPKNFEASFWRNQFEVLENVIGRRFIDVSIEKKKINLFFDNLPDIVPFSRCPPLKPMEVWLGINQFSEHVKINLQSTPAIYVDGKPGSGKTVVIESLMRSYQKGVGEKIKVLAVTTKEPDFYPFQKEFDIQIIDTFNGDIVQNVEKIISFMNLSNEMESYKEINKNNQIDPDSRNLGKLREEGIYKDQPRKFFIFDEAKDYLSKDRADSKEEAQAKQKLVKAVYSHIRRNARFLSTPIIVASQTQTETDLDIPLKAFHLRLASNTNEAMSKLLCGDKRLTDLSFSKGKYFLKTDTQEHIVKIPF